MAINPFLVLNNSFIIALKIKQMKMLLLMTGILLHVKFYLPLLLDATHLTIPYHTIPVPMYMIVYRDVKVWSDFLKVNA